MARRTRVLRLATAGPSDTAPLAAAIDKGEVDPATIVAIVGKTEGNGCVNDFTRGYATLALKLLLGDRRVAIVMSGGTEGGLSPHLLVFCREEAQGVANGKRLAIGTGFTRDFKPEEIGRQAQINETAAAVASAMKEAGIASAADVHFVQIKCPLLVAQRVAEADRRGAAVATRDTLKSMALSRAASALGAAVALGEIDRAALSDTDIGANWSLWSGRASASAGIELINHEIVVMGMSPSWSGPLSIDHAVMGDAIDVEPVRAALKRLGLDSAGQLPPAQRGRLVALLGKAEASHDGQLRGHRHTMLDDSDIAATRHARAFVCGALAALVGHAEIYVSGGAEHQGPDGGGPVALIVDRAAS